MELKSYQKQVLKDLNAYLSLLCETKDYKASFRLFWQEKGVPSLGHYQDLLPGVPILCFKVPTGGGKTFLAASSIHPVFDALPATKTKAVVWLVPSDAILTQTVKALKDTANPYRQKIDVDFGGRVEVYTKQELLNGQNFNPTSVTEQLSIMVLSYDSFRGRGKEGLKAYQENSNLAAFSKVLGKPDAPIEKADETALFQVINQLSPLVIVDESHHARSDLSLEMLTNFNPCFVLDLTATPKAESNIISYVDAVALKGEHMVKLPVIVYNRDSQIEVLTDTIDFRNRLEEIAKAEERMGGKYIRPIALLQAQPKGKEDAATFEKLRDKLVEQGVPAETIAIRTADVNELKNVDLLSPDCPVRYIITVNALKEGWDCPFAYILASLANKTSQVDVEQILGRILRLPYTKEHGAPSLNMSYVLTSSNNFHETVTRIIKGLNNAGFSAKDYRLTAPSVSKTPEPTVEQIAIQEPSEEPEDDIVNLDWSAVGEELFRRQEQRISGETPRIPSVDTMLETAEQAGQAYEQELKDNDDDPAVNDMPMEVREKMESCRVKPEFADEIQHLRIPQFHLEIPQTLFTDGQYDLLERAHLARDFSLKGKPYDIDFASADDEIVQVDIRQQESGLPRAFKMESAEQKLFKEYFSSLSPEGRIRQCKANILKQLNKLDSVDSGELTTYVERIIEELDRTQLSALEKAPQGYAETIRKKIESLMEEHYYHAFKAWLDTERIVCKPSYLLPSAIHPVNIDNVIGGSLYDGEEGDMNQLEQDLAMELTAMPNVRWWHRIITRRGFCINGYINHYPDFMVMMQSGKIVLVETKGGDRDNTDSKRKLELGKLWAQYAGKQYRYYMVFRDGDSLLDGAKSMSDFKETMRLL